MGILGKLFGKKEPHATQSKPSSATSAVSSSSPDEEYIKYIMSNNPNVTRDEVVAFLAVVDIYDNTGNKAKTMEAFDSFINQLATSNPMRAMMVNGFFCGLLGSNMSLSKAEVDTLAQKNTPLIISKLNQK